MKFNSSRGLFQSWAVLDFYEEPSSSSSLEWFQFQFQFGLPKKWSRESVSGPVIEKKSGFHETRSETSS